MKEEKLNVDLLKDGILDETKSDFKLLTRKIERSKLNRKSSTIKKLQFLTVTCALLFIEPFIVRIDRI